MDTPASVQRFAARVAQLRCQGWTVEWNSGGSFFWLIGRR